MVDEAGATRRIAEFVAATRLESIPAAAVEGAKLSILDTLGCALAGLSQPVAREILDYVRGLGGRPVATMLGCGGERSSAPNVALANACLANILDLDGFLHAPTYVLPAALAAGELTGAGGRQVLEAYILAFEVASRLREAIEARRGEEAGPTYRGWYHVSLYGPLAASLAAGRVLGLDVDALQGAMGAAACGAGGVRVNLGARAKSLSSGVAASLGVQAAMLAARGVTGATNILEAPLGLINAICLPGECDWEPIQSDLGAPYRLAAASLGTKRYPAIGATQGLLGGLANVCRTAGLRPDDVASVDAHVSTFAASDRAPQDELEAGFSWPYLIAATLMDGAFGVEHLDRARISDASMQALMARIRFLPPDTGEREQIVIHLRDGRMLDAGADARLGRVGRDEIEEKYRVLAMTRLPAQQVQSLQEQVMQLDQLPSLAGLMSILAA